MGMVLQLKAAMTFYGACPVGTKSPPFFLFTGLEPLQWPPYILPFTQF